jgi:hypothetical protein
MSTMDAKNVGWEDLFRGEEETWDFANALGAIEPIENGETLVLILLGVTEEE